MNIAFAAQPTFFSQSKTNVSVLDGTRRAAPMETAL